MNKKLLIGLGIAAVAATVITVAVVHEIKKIRKVANDIDESEAENEKVAED